eukprot:13657354-Heterocapsa_arctica.AAC.1
MSRASPRRCRAYLSMRSDCTFARAETSARMTLITPSESGFYISSFFTPWSSWSRLVQSVHGMYRSTLDSCISWA